MATIQLYNHTAQLFQAGSNIAADTYKVILLNASASFDATHTTVDQVTNTGAYEVYGNGWTQGGETIANVAMTTVDTNDSKFAGDNISVAISGGNLGPFSAYVIVNSTDSKPLAYVTLDAPATVVDGVYAQIVWNTDGIIRIDYT
jgi:hypothetical protein